MTTATVSRSDLAQKARQAPVATDLRLLSAILHINVHLERIGDMGVNIAKIFLSVKDLPSSPAIVGQIQEMDDVVRPMIRTSVQSQECVGQWSSRSRARRTNPSVRLS